jgi:Fanconi-associated nuclease 1
MNPNFTALIHRLHIVGFRATEHPTRLLLPSLLTHFRKRSYPAYIPVRHGSIWPRREDLLEFEEALLLRHRLDEIMNPPKSKEVPTPLAKTPGPKQETDSATPKAAPKELSASQKIAQMAKEFIEAENVFQKWNRFLERPEYGLGDQQEGRGPGLVRFEAGEACYFYR